MSSAPSGFHGLSLPCGKISAHAGHEYQPHSTATPRYCPGTPRPLVDAAEQMLADVRLVAQFTEMDVRRFAVSVLEACAEADAAQGVPGDVTTDEIRALLQRTADGR